MMKKKRILVVDDEPNIREVVDLYLRREGFDVEVAVDGEAALEAIERKIPDLIVLDLMMPKAGGLQVTRILRDNFDIPIIMLTAKSQEEEKIAGLELGADDYVTKPFSPRELVTRVKVVLRRAVDKTKDDEQQIALDFESLRIDPKTRQVIVSEQAATLTCGEWLIPGSLPLLPRGLDRSSHHREWARRLG